MQFKPMNAVVGFCLYAALFGVLFANQQLAVASMAALYIAACMSVTGLTIVSAQARRSTKIVEFSCQSALAVFGLEWGSFHHIFDSRDDSVIPTFQQNLSKSLDAVFGCHGLQEVQFKDVDRYLEAPETRPFFQAEVTETIRNTKFTLVCTFSRAATVQSVRWWILFDGPRDPNCVFWRYMLSPLALPLVFWAYMRGEYDPLNGLTTICPSFFNAVDALASARKIQYVAFETLVQVLESFNIDTSDLKQQKGNILNINVTGGQINFGSVVQGAMNRVSGAVREWKHEQ